MSKRSKQISKPDYDVIIVGAGLIGACFALKLAQETHFSVLLVEQAQRLTANNSPNQRVLALSHAATELLEQVGVFFKLDITNCYPYQYMFVWDDLSSGELEFDAINYQQGMLGHMVDAVSLTMLLQAALDQQPQITVEYDLVIEKLELRPNSALIQTANGQLSSSLMVAADGANSWCRRQAKIFANRQSYKQSGIVARIKTEKSHQDTAWQIFLNSGPLALLPLHDNQCSIVWSATNQLADELAELSDEEFSNAIATALNNKLGSVELLSQRQTFPLVSVKAETYFKPRFALLGDAAHCIHPLAGQGANLGFKDAAALVDVLKTETAQAIGALSVLERYQRARKSNNEQTDMMMSALHFAYQHDASWWAGLRGVGMNWLGKSTNLKSIFAKQAMGLL